MKHYRALLFFLSSILLIQTSCTWEQLEPTIDCSIAPVSVQLLETQPTLCNISSGTISVTASGGTEEFEFVLGNKRNDNGLFEGLDAGLYTVIAIDGNGCSNQVIVTVGNSEGVNLDGIQVTDAGCGSQNGSIVISASGGQEPYAFKLSTGTVQTGNTFSNLARGNYTVTVTDQSGCESTTSANVLSGVSFESSIKNIINTNCAVSGCHNGSVSPDLRSFSTIQARASAIKSRTASGNMPKDRTLTQQQKDLIACWVDDGALQN